MKLRAIILMAAAAALASCAGRLSDVTEMEGTVKTEGVSEVRVQVSEVLYTIVPVVDGKFSVGIPADLTSAAHIYAGRSKVLFISDGTPLTVVIDEESKVTSRYPKISAQERLNEYKAEEAALLQEYKAKQNEIYSDTLLNPLEKNVRFEEYYESFIGGYVDHHVKAAELNTDNFVSIFALSNLRGQIDDARMEPLINGLSEDIQNTKYVSGLKKALSARLDTAEGKMFVDFTVNTVAGMTRSIPPQPKYREVKFSDYVGRGKYVLVDFWSPWCGPCKREIPNIKAVYEKYRGKGLEVLSIAVWERQPVQVTIDTAAELGMDWLHINNAGSVPTDIYGIEGIPHLMLIGPDGTILKRGFHGLDGIETAVSEYMK